MLYFQKRGCDATISNEFRFQEVKDGKHFLYKYNNILCLGVELGCDATLKLITASDDTQKNRCYFEKLRH